MKYLTSLMDNVIASRLGDIAINAGARRLDVGDSIDRGLILLRLLNEGGFKVIIAKDAAKKRTCRKCLIDEDTERKLAGEYWPIDEDPYNDS
jgi:hypothetical protein